MRRNLIETLMGAIVLIVAAFFVFTTYQSSGIKKDYGYRLSALFDKADGITTGSDVRLGGIKIGTVVAQKLDPQTYRANVTLGIENDVKIPIDSTAQIVSDGLLGGKYISLVPGAENEMLGDGGVIEYTQGSVNLEQLIGKIAFGGTDENAGGKASPTEAAANPPANTPPSKEVTIVEQKPVAVKPTEATPEEEEPHEINEPRPIMTPKPNMTLKRNTAPEEGGSD